MIDFFKMKYYSIESKTAKNGLEDLKRSTLDIKNNFGRFSFISIVFVFVAIFKDWIFAHAAMGNVDYEKENSLLLSGDANIGFIGYVLSFFVLFMVYFFTIDMFAEMKSKLDIKTSVKFCFYKLIDYRLYLIAFTLFLFIIFTLKIATYPVLDALPNVELQNIVDFFGRMSVASDGGEQQFLLFLETDEFYNNASDAIGSVGLPTLVFYISSALIFFIFSLVIHFSMFINILLYNNMTLFESFKAALKINFNNSMYLMTVTSLMMIIIICYIFLKNNYVIGYSDVILSALVNVYSLYIFTWVIVNNTKEKKN